VSGSDVRGELLALFGRLPNLGGQLLSESFRGGAGKMKTAQSAPELKWLLDGGTGPSRAGGAHRPPQPPVAGPDKGGGGPKRAAAGQDKGGGGPKRAAAGAGDAGDYSDGDGGDGSGDDDGDYDQQVIIVALASADVGHAACAYCCYKILCWHDTVIIFYVQHVIII